MLLKGLKIKSSLLLIATDVAARGIDVANLPMLLTIHYLKILESYVHRIGRTGRAGKEGIAITFINAW